MVKFPYREEGNPPILRPTVDIRLTSEPTGEWTTRALIDTGSPLTIFDRGVAEALVINIGYTGSQKGYVALLGARRPVQFEYVDLSLSAALPPAFLDCPRGIHYRQNLSNAIPRNPGRRRFSR